MDTSIPIISGSLDDLSCIIIKVREHVIRKAAKIAKVRPSDALDKLIRKNIIRITPADAITVPIGVAPVPVPTPASAPPALTPKVHSPPRATSAGKVPYFENDMTIPRLEAMRDWDPDVHCHGRKRIGFCGRKQFGDGPPLCKQCLGIYGKFKANIQGGWRGFVTEPFHPSINEKEYKQAMKIVNGNTYINTDGNRVMCKWAYFKYYWPYYHPSIGAVYYDHRSGIATTKMPVDWDRGHPSEQADPMEDAVTFDIGPLLASQGWSKSICN